MTDVTFGLTKSFLRMIYSFIMVNLSIQI